jgi:hypothetical protein
LLEVFYVFAKLLVIFLALLLSSFLLYLSLSSVSIKHFLVELEKKAALAVKQNSGFNLYLRPLLGLLGVFIPRQAFRPSLVKHLLGSLSKFL